MRKEGVTVIKVLFFLLLTTLPKNVFGLEDFSFQHYYEPIVTKDVDGSLKDFEAAGDYYTQPEYERLDGSDDVEGYSLLDTDHDNSPAKYEADDAERLENEFNNEEDGNSGNVFNEFYNQNYNHKDDYNDGGDSKDQQHYEYNNKEQDDLKDDNNQHKDHEHQHHHQDHDDHNGHHDDHHGHHGDHHEYNGLHSGYYALPYSYHY